MPVSPLKYTKNISLKITDIQHGTLQKLKSRNIRVSQFIRDAISEKINREASELIAKPKKEITPF